MYEQLDIVLMPFPFNDLTSNKVRPALIYSNSSLKYDKICILITSKESKQGFELTKDLLEKSLPLRSWIKVHRIFTIDEKRIIKRIGKGNTKLLSLINEKFEEIIKYKI